MIESAQNLRSTGCSCCSEPASSLCSSEQQIKTRNIMAKLRRKHGQTVLLLDDSPESSSALKKNMNKTQSTKKEILTSESITRLEKLTAMSLNDGSALNVALIYEDAQTREWARGAYERIAKVAADQGVRPTWWNLENLGDPGVLAAAVSTAMRADVIVLAARAAEGMPLAFYAWINAWLPNRFQRGGVLAALLGKTERSGARPVRVGEYLREVARQGRMSFLLETRKLEAQANGSNGHVHSLSANGSFYANHNLAAIRF
jgi:hypothetical protein